MTRIAIEAAARLGTLIESHALDVGHQLGEWLRPWLRDGETLPDFTLVLQLPARMIGQAGQRLRESQDKLDESRSHEGEAQVWRDHTAAMLRRKLVEIRRLLTLVFGSRHTAMLLDIEGKTAKASQYALLLSQADAFLRVLRDPRRLAISGDAYFDPASVAATLEPLIRALREAYGQLDEIRQASAARLEAREHARGELNRGMECVVCILSGWLVLIRRADLAEKIRRLRRPEKVSKAKKVTKAKNRPRKEVPM